MVYFYRDPDGEHMFETDYRSRSSTIQKDGTVPKDGVFLRTIDSRTFTKDSIHPQTNTFTKDSIHPRTSTFTKDSTSSKEWIFTEETTCLRSW